MTAEERLESRLRGSGSEPLQQIGVGEFAQTRVFDGSADQLEEWSGRCFRHASGSLRSESELPTNSSSKPPKEPDFFRCRGANASGCWPSSLGSFSMPNGP